MKTRLSFQILALFTLSLVGHLQADPPAQAPLTNFSKLKDGDMLFIESSTPRAEIIKDFTKSTLTHCGVVFWENGKWMIYEGVGNYPPLDVKHWQERESGGAGNAMHPLYVRRLKNRDQLLSPTKVDALKELCKKLHHTQYDFGFAWNNKDGNGKPYIYCSELLFKTFDEAVGVKLGTPLPLKHYYEDKPSAEAAKIKQDMDKNLNSTKSKDCRNGKSYNPEELAISPVEVFNSTELDPVTDN